MNRWFFALTALLLLTGGVYAHGLWNAGFVWDDVPLIEMNEALGHGGQLPRLFMEDLWATSGAGDVASGYYRPLVLVDFSLDKMLFGSAPLGFHLHSLAWHLVAVTALFFLLKDMVGEGAGLAGATLFALHPAQSESVAWISARNDLMAATFGLLAVLAVLRLQRSRVWWWIGAGLACAAMLSKESAVLVPVLLLAVDLSRPSGRRGIRRYAALVFGIGLALGLRAMAGVGSAALPPIEGWLLFVDRIGDWAGIMSAAVVWPFPVTSARDLHWTDMEPLARIAVGWAGLLSLAVVLVVSRGRRRRMIAGGLLWAAVSLALTIVPMADKGGFGDRFWYLPLVGIALVLAAAIPQKLGPWVAVAVAVPSVVILAVRLPDWTDDARLWAAAARDVPIPINHVGLGHAYSRDGKLIKAHRTFVGALTTDRLANDACPRVVGTAVRIGKFAHGARMGSWVRQRGCPLSSELVGWLATAQALTGAWGDARATLDEWGEAPEGRGLVVAAALARRDGDLPTEQRLLADREDLASAVGLLLDAADKYASGR